MDKISEWISVGVQLPEERTPVLLFFGGLPFEIGYLRKCDKTWWRNDRKLGTPTHWRPLPEQPPKPDAFEEWWFSESSSRLSCSACSKANAKAVWDAAIESAGRP